MEKEIDQQQTKAAQYQAKNFKEVVALLVLIAIALVVVVFLPNILGIEGSLWLSHVGVFILGIQCSLFFNSATSGGYSI